MPIFLELIITFLLVFGFYYLGSLISKLLKLDRVLILISEPKYQYTSVGISFFLFLIYPIFFLKIYTGFFFKTIAILVITLGIYHIIINYKIIVKQLSKDLIKIKNFNFAEQFIFLLILLYFVISLCPPVSGDSVAYHLSISKYIVHNGFFAENFFDFEAKLSGAGELFNAFALAINAPQFTSFIHFIGLYSISGILIKFSSLNNLSKNNICFLFLLILSSPLLIFLIATSKPQFFYISLVVISYAYLFILNKKNTSNDVLKIFTLCNILLLTSVVTKISFSLTFFIFNFFFIFSFYKNKFFFKQILLLFFLSSIALLPPALWKSELYNYSFYKFFFNPLPVNMTGYENYYLFLKNYESEKFPLLFLFPSSLGTFTTTTGVGTLSLLFLIIYNFKDKAKLLLIIFLFSIIFLFVGQKSPRFFFEIYIVIVLFFSRILQKIQNGNYFKLFRASIIIQSFAVIFSLIWGVMTIFPANFNDRLNGIVLSKYADGYSLYNWVNSVLPRDASIIVNHRSTYFLQTNNYLLVSALTSIEYDNNEARDFYLKDIQKYKPNFILFTGTEDKRNYGDFNFEDCLIDQFSSALKVGNQVARNPFNVNKNNSYNAYIFKFDYKKMPQCVKKNLN
jgi:hypothetical protein